jgi:hypothetical protein
MFNLINFFGHYETLKLLDTKMSQIWSEFKNFKKMKSRDILPMETCNINKACVVTLITIWVVANLMWICDKFVTQI